MRPGDRGGYNKPCPLDRMLSIDMASAKSRKPRLRFPGQNKGLGLLSSVKFTRKPREEDDKNTEKKTDWLPFKVT